MRHADWFFVTKGPQRFDIGKPSAQACHKLWHLIEVSLRPGACDDRFDRRMFTPQIGTTQSTNTRNFHLFSCGKNDAHRNGGILAQCV
jgi:hypothetical protein